jgi:MFS transporter, ACDE family, multidrug resistance protein
MYANLAAFAVVVLVIAIWTTDRAVLIPAVIISGIFIGVNDTITTQAVMTVSPAEKPVASAAYGSCSGPGSWLPRTACSTRPSGYRPSRS